MSTVQRRQLNAVANSVTAVAAGPAAALEEPVAPATDIKFCAIDDPGCEACQ